MLSDSVGVLKGVGEVKRKALSSMGIDTVGDLLFTVPRAYEDRTKLFGIAEAFSLSYPVCIKATVGTRPKKPFCRAEDMSPNAVFLTTGTELS